MKISQLLPLCLTLLTVASVSLRAATDPHDSLVPPQINLSPGPEYADTTRIFQGIPGMERATNGRLWALWYAGGPDEPGEGGGNYVVLVTSDDDGKTWSGPKLVIDPPGDVRAYDPALWQDPQGKLWLFWAQSSHWWDGRSGTWCITTDNAGDASPQWSAPRRLCNGIMMNKPTVLKNGDWLLPISMWAMKPDKRTRTEHRHELPDESGAQVVISRDQGKTFTFLGKTRAPENIFDEHMIVEKRDGSLWMLIRTKFGIADSLSTDGGKTWPPAKASNIPHVNSRFFIRRLNSGNLLLVKHNPPDNKTRSHLTAYISKDDGQTWEGGLMLDERTGVSYPDGTQDKDGIIRIIYDFARTDEKVIHMAAFTEQDVLAGKPSATTRLQIKVNQSTAKSPPPKKEEPKQAAKAPNGAPFAKVILNPGADYDDLHRSWQGIPGIERAPKGRLWATWYSGDKSEGDIGNYALVATSGNDGKNWSKPVVVIQGLPGTRIGDPLPWLDPKGRLWIFYAQLSKENKTGPSIQATFAIRTDHPDQAAPEWTPPMLIQENGILFGKPLVRSQGGWLAPFFQSRAAEGAKETGVLLSENEGQSWAWLGGTTIAPELRNFSEATIAQRKDASILMVIRTQKGLYESNSADGGQSWSDANPLFQFAGPATRACLLRLASGAFLLIYHDAIKTSKGALPRHRLTAWLSDDEGKTWPHQLMLDERSRVSYPDARQAPDGRIYVAYDHGRYEPGEKEILVSILREEDVRSGKITSTDARTRLQVNRALAYGNGAELRAEKQVAEAMPNKEQLHVYLLIGQSNMAGRGLLDTEKRLPRSRILKFSPSNQWTSGIEPLHYDKPTIAGAGLGMSFARSMAAAHPEATIGLVPCAVGGTPLERWMKGGDLYNAALARAQLALQSGTLKGIIWHQGEADSGSESTARNYAQRLTQMITDLRADLAAPDCPFVAGKLGEFLAKESKEGKPSFWPVVNEQLASIPAQVPHSAVVESSGLKDKGDGVHFDTPGLREFGNRYAKAMQQLQR